MVMIIDNSCPALILLIAPLAGSLYQTGIDCALVWTLPIEVVAFVEVSTLS